MASMVSEIRMERRQCVVGGIRAMFHCWSHVSQIVPPSISRGGHSGGVVSNTYGIVEYPSGQVERVKPENIVFVDGGDFNDYHWPFDEDKEEK